MTTPSTAGAPQIVNINKPAPNESAQVKTGSPSVICACGNASASRKTPQTVYAWVYQGNIDPGQIPITPPGDAVSTTPGAGGAWFFSGVPNPASSALPGSSDTLVVWVLYTDGTYEYSHVYFKGVASTQTECEVSPTYCE